MLEPVPAAATARQPDNRTGRPSGISVRRRERDTGDSSNETWAELSRQAVHRASLLAESLLARAPGALQVAWPASRRHQHDIETQRGVGEIGPALQEMLERAGDAAALFPQYRVGSAHRVGTCLDFDRGNSAAAPRDEIDLAHGRAIALRQDAIALQP